MRNSLTYDGQRLTWHHGDGTQTVYKATSGLVDFDDKGNVQDHRKSAEQCKKSEGPIPNGKYYLLLKIEARNKGYARNPDPDWCSLRPSPLIQRIPRGGNATAAVRGAAANACEATFANWGWNRVGLKAADSKTRNACTPRRGSFYLHDSTKGFTHGCVEVEGRFFIKLRRFALSGKLTKMYLTVKYKYASTYGGTRKPKPPVEP